MIPCNLLKNWSAEQVAQMHNAIFVAQHRLAEMELFSDEGLARILDAHPRSDLIVSTMGSNPGRPDQLQTGDPGRIDGRTLLEIASRSRLCLTLRHVTDHHDEYRLLVNALYDELESLCGCGPLFDRSANLSISSPTAIEYYHVGRRNNILWHVRGTARVWVYPLEAGILSARMLEAVLCGEKSEDIEYYPELDRYARVVDLEPGRVITWPQHTPRRSANTGGLNVSLFTEHMTGRAVRKNNVYLANRHFRRMFGAHFRSTKLDGFVPAMKDLAIRAARRLPLVAPERLHGHESPITFEVDPLAPDGIRPLGATPPATPIVTPMPAISNINAPIPT